MADWELVREKIDWRSPDNDGGDLAIAMLAAGATPTAILCQYGIEPGIRLQDKRAIFYDLFGIPEAYSAIRDFHRRGFRMDALAALFLDEYECDHGLPSSMPEMDEL